MMKGAPTDRRKDEGVNGSVGKGGAANGHHHSEVRNATCAPVSTNQQLAGITALATRRGSTTKNGTTPPSRTPMKNSGLTDDEMDRIKEEEKLTQLSPAVTLVLQDDNDSKNQHNTSATTPQKQNQNLPAIRRRKAGSSPSPPRRNPSNHQWHQLQQFQEKAATPDDTQSRLKEGTTPVVQEEGSGNSHPNDTTTASHPSKRPRATQRKHSGPPRLQPETAKRSQSESTDGLKKEEGAKKNDDTWMKEIKEQERITRLNPAVTLALKNSATSVEAPAIAAKATSTSAKTDKKPKIATRSISNTTDGLKEGTKTNDDQLMDEIKEQERITRLNPPVTLALKNSATSAEAPALAAKTTAATTTSAANDKKAKAVFVKMESGDDDDWRRRMRFMNDGDSGALAQLRHDEQQRIHGPSYASSRPRISTSSSDPVAAKSAPQKSPVHQGNGGESGENSDDLMKIVAKRSYDSELSELSDEFTRQQRQQSAAMHTGTSNGTNDDTAANYSQNAKKRIQGGVQPGAFGAAPGVQPSRNLSLRYSALTRPSTAGIPSTMEFTTTTTTMDEETTSEMSQQQLDTYQQELENYRRDQEDSNQSLLKNSATLTSSATSKEPISKRNQGLVEAHLVLSEPQIKIQADKYEAPPQEFIAAKEHRRRCRLAQSLCILLLVFTVVVLLILFAADAIFPNHHPDQTTHAPSSMPSLSPTIAPTYYQHNVGLPNYTLEVMETNPYSPQARAYDWIQEDDMFDSYSPYRQLQRFVLATFYFATNGDSWIVNKNWLSHDLHECTWHTKGLDLEGTGTPMCEDEQVVALLLTKNGLSGRLPPELSLLTTLQVLDVATNDVKGTIPSQLALLTSLRELVLDVNELSGEVPSELGQLALLEWFYVHTNNIIGTMITELGLLTNLKDLAWGRTMTRGTLPTELGRLVKSTNLWLGSNALEGPLPSELFLLTDLNESVVLGNQFLSGTIPSEIGMLSNLWGMFLAGNSLSGSIPTEVGLMTALNQLYLARNNLTSTLPTTVGTMQNMTYLYFSHNHVNGSIPTEIGTMSNLEYLDFENNTMSGTVPAQVGQLSALIQFRANDQSFSGALPHELGMLSNLKFLDVGRNQLNSTIPSEFMQIASLEEVKLEQNFLYGPLPSEIGLLVNLTWLVLDSNYLSSSIPPEFFAELRSLEHLHLQDNHLTGALPSEISALRSLVDLRLNATFLNGTIPTEIALLAPNLEHLDLSSTNISGSIPSELGTMTSLTWLKLDNTQLSGEIPTELSNLAVNGSLARFNINDTLVNGEIPSDLCAVPDFHFDCSFDLCGCFCVCLSLAHGNWQISLLDDFNVTDDGLWG
ncbi:LRR receptor-like serine threonine-protein kinase [Seminavis robusta]|uniref:LRR receptor-like serine threonine-protein kinase n=1 Tax=Seminavis robusta TaxID=568900 RepID=A0A9N8DL22_9STRA|nr:LRR receptor-like serine threonine-protein kinase [Seminavis robusta]|eukprot:Sro181_g079220.1 LRR receptor-like serine threonine-protein kinase (1332) ;mRNA; f:91558-95553